MTTRTIVLDNGKTLEIQDDVPLPSKRFSNRAPATPPEIAALAKFRIGESAFFPGVHVAPKGTRKRKDYNAFQYQLTKMRKRHSIRLESHHMVEGGVRGMRVWKLRNKKS